LAEPRCPVQGWTDEQRDCTQFPHFCADATADSCSVGQHIDVFSVILGEMAKNMDFDVRHTGFTFHLCRGLCNAGRLLPLSSTVFSSVQWGHQFLCHGPEGWINEVTHVGHGAGHLTHSSFCGAQWVAPPAQHTVSLPGKGID